VKRALLVLVLLLTACARPQETSSVIAPPVVSVYTSPAAEPWLQDVYACAREVSVVIRLSASESAADIRLRLGEPKTLSTPAYQIGAEDILIVTNRDSPLEGLTVDEARALFSQGRENVELWVYASSADVQEVFEREVLFGERIHPLARLALHPQQMLDTLSNEKNAIGILPRRWMNKTMREVFRLAGVPMLAITPGEPQEAVKELLACLQK
jgi:hypothetical protein